MYATILLSGGEKMISMISLLGGLLGVSVRVGG